jgi:isoprenylcysteine carboxyl methyltransferase (ICMT) family protein YpbQ
LLDSTADWIRLQSPAILVLLVTALMYAGEKRVHKYNYDYLMSVGGEELIPDLMRRYYRYTFFMPLIAYLTGQFLPSTWAPWKATFPGLFLITFGFVLRIWSERSLGRLWTERCIYIPDLPRADQGPYRFLRHPEYLARSVEGLGFILFFAINPMSLLFWLRTLTLSSRIVKVESRQLHELSAMPLQLPSAKGKSTVGASKL